MYVEGGGPVLILEGEGLDVEDDDHNEIFLMQVASYIYNASSYDYFSPSSCREP